MFLYFFFAGSANGDTAATSAGGGDNGRDANKLNEMKPNAGSVIPSQLSETKLFSERKPLPPIRLPSIELDGDHPKATKTSGYEAAAVVADDTVTNEVKFIDNGIDVSSTSNIIQAMRDEIDEMSNEVKNKSDELTIKYDGIVKEEMDSMKNIMSTKMSDVKNGSYRLHWFCLGL